MLLLYIALALAAILWARTMLNILLVVAVVLWVVTLLLLWHTDQDLRPLSAPRRRPRFSPIVSLVFSLLIIVGLVGLVVVFNFWDARNTVRLLWFNRWAVGLAALLVGLVPLA